MPRLIRCPHCRSAGSVTPDAAGRTVRCSGCSAVFEVPAPRAGSTSAIQRILIEAALWLTNALPAIIRTIWASTIVHGCRRHLKTSFRIVVRTVQQWSQNQNTSAGAALAFYAVFAIVPLFFVAIFSCATIFGQERSTRQIERGVYRAIGPEIGEDAAELLEDFFHCGGLDKSATPRSRSFAAHVDKNCWRCFRCGAGGNALDLYLAVPQLPVHAGTLELCARLHIGVPWRPVPASRSPP